MLLSDVMGPSLKPPALLRRAFVVFWAGLSVLGGLNHNVVRGLYDRNGWIPAIFPHLRWGYVMFNKMPDEMPVVDFRPLGGEGDYRHLGEAIPTPAIGYSMSRASVNYYFYRADYLGHLCAVSPEMEGMEFRIRVFQIKDKQKGATREQAKVIETAYQGCRNGKLFDQRAR